MLRQRVTSLVLLKELQRTVNANGNHILNEKKNVNTSIKTL
jgi:hypothetical protein